ncbi:MAG TPA: glycosyltransferase [Burkholderiales bacterium]|nr:glycosyltransferase [Burkholderiales bacterium]
MQLIFVNRYFYPDLSATSQLLSDLAFHLAGRGVRVTVVTSRLLYDDAAATLPRFDRINGVEIRRVSTTRFGRSGLRGRALDYISFYFSAAWMLLRVVRRGDALVAKTDPPLISVIALAVARIKGARMVNWLQDVFPEVAGALGLRVGTGILGKAIAAFRDWSVAGAALNIVLGERMAAVLRGRGVPQERICTIPNWADDTAITPVEASDNPLASEWGLADKFVVGYSGNLGRAHEFETILDAAGMIQHDDRTRLLFVGSGAQAEMVRQAVVQRGLTNCIFRDYQPRERLALSLSVPALHLVSLRPEMEGFIVPSKFYGIAAAGRPAAFVGAEDGEVARILRRHDCGRSFQIGDAAGLAQYIRQLAGDPDEIRRLGANARAALDREYSQQRAFAAWRQALSSVLDVRIEAEQSERRPKVIFFANTDWYLYNFRLGFANYLRQRGLDVVMLSPSGPYGPLLRAAGFRWIALDMDRRSLNPVRELRLIRRIASIYAVERPDIVHHFTIKCVVYGSFVARAQRIARVNAVTGMGHVFSGQTARTRLLRPVVQALIKAALSGERARLILQNRDDVAAFVGAGLTGNDRTHLIMGSGVNTRVFQPGIAAKPDGRMRVLLASRLLWDKGIGEYVAAATLLQSRNLPIDFLLAGSPDPGNPASISDAQLTQWQQTGVVTYLGHITGMPQLLATIDVAVLPSYREGVPRSLLEAAACGLPIVTTDAPGCREIVMHGQNGLLVPPRDSLALAEAIRYMYENADARARMGSAGRRAVLEWFDENIVFDRTLSVYEQLLPYTTFAGRRRGSQQALQES